MFGAITVGVFGASADLSLLECLVLVLTYHCWSVVGVSGASTNLSLLGCLVLVLTYHCWSVWC